MAVPIACTLSAADLSRRREVFAAVRATCRRVEEAEDGVRLTFDAAEGMLSRLADLIDLERTCCRFLTFRLEVAPDGGPITLTLSGPPGTAAFLRGELGLEASG